MSDDSYHEPPIAIPIPPSSNIRTYFSNWRLTRSLVHPFEHSHVRHIREYHPLLCTSSSPFYVVQCAGSHQFEFLHPEFNYPYLVVQFTILPSAQSHLPLTYTTPHSIDSCPTIFVVWRELPWFPPNRDLDNLTHVAPHLTFIRDYLQRFIDYYYSPLAPFTTPLDIKQ